MSEVDELKTRHRAMWAAGDYDRIAELIWPVGAVAAQAAGIEAGMDVLDVAVGTGNVAIRAAQQGAKVVGVDLTSELFGAGRVRAEAAGVQIEWVEGDAEALPFEDDSFDRVVSTFGVMFAPRHDVAVDELVRVCRPGGSIVLTTWAVDGFGGRLFAAFGRHLPPPPQIASPPGLWGVEGHVRQLLGGRTLLAFERHTVEFVFDSVDAMVDEYEAHFGPLVTARRALEAQGTYDDLVADLRALFEDLDIGEGEARIPAEYLLIVGHKPAS